MNDITFETYDESKSKYQKTQFLDFTFGAHQVRLLGHPKKIFVHYYKNRGSIQCLGSECPICRVNKSLQAEFPENYKQQPNYNGSSPRHYINVLDRTPVKVCPNSECQHENKMDLMGHFPSSCSKCGTFLGDVQVGVSDKIKVANISSTNADRLMALRVAVRDDNGEPLGLGNFDLEFIVTSVKGKKDISVQASSRKNANDPIEVPEETLYNLDNVVIKLSPEEIVQFMRGVSLKDIFTARKGTTSDAKEEVVNTTVLKSLEDTLKELGFN